MGNSTSHLDTFATDRLPLHKDWPEFIFDLPELRYPERINCATLIIDDAVEEGYGNNIAVYSDDSVVSYADLLENSNRVAEVLTKDMRLIPGNRVLLRAPNCPMLVAA